MYACVSCNYSLIIHAIYKFPDMAAVEHSSIVDTHKYMGLSMMSWMCLHDLFLQILSGVQFLTWNVILYTCEALI